MGFKLYRRPFDWVCRNPGGRLYKVDPRPTAEKPFMVSGIRVLWFAFVWR